MAVHTQIVLCYVLFLGTFAAAEHSAKRAKGEDVMAALLAYSRGRVGHNDGLQTTYYGRPRLIFEKLNSPEEKREQGNAGIWGKRQEPSQWEGEYEAQKQRTEGDARREHYGNTDNWGKGKLQQRRASELHSLWESQEQPPTGLWGKRSKRGMAREGRELAEKKRKQPSNIGLWKGKRGIRGERPYLDGKNDLWGRREQEKDDMWQWQDESNELDM